MYIMRLIPVLRRTGLLTSSSILNTYKFNVVRTRQFTNQYWIHPAVENRFKTKDSIPMDYVLIYNSKMQLFIYCTYHFMKYFTILGLSGLAYLVYYEDTLNKGTVTDNSILLSDKEVFRSFMAKGDDRDFMYYLSHAIMILTIIGFFYVASYICRAYPLRIYHSAEKRKYISIYHGKWLTNTDVVCSSQDNMAKMFKDTLLSNMFYRLNGRPTILLPEFFRSPTDYKKMRDACE